MDTGILDPLFDAIESHTKRINKLDSSSEKYSDKLDKLKDSFTDKFNKLIDKLEDKVASKDLPNYDLLTRLLAEDAERLIEEHNQTVDEVRESFTQQIKKDIPSAIKEYIASIQEQLTGEKGTDGLDGKNGIQGKQGLKGEKGITGISGKDGKPGKDGKDGKDGKSLSDSNIKKIIKAEIAKIKLPKSSNNLGLPVAPVPANGLSMLAVKEEIALALEDLGGGSGDLLSTNNLSDLTDAVIALSNLGLTATAEELNYTDGVTSSIQNQLDSKSTSNKVETLTNKALVSHTNNIHADAIHTQVRNESGILLKKGMAVAYSDYNNSEETEVILANNTVTAPSIGLISGVDIPNGELGTIISTGIITGIDTDAISDENGLLENNIAYVNGSGLLTMTQPTTGFMQPIAFVIKEGSGSEIGILQVLAAYPKQDAADVRVDSSSFSRNLSTNEDTIQKALNKLDNNPFKSIGLSPHSNPSNQDEWVDSSTMLNHIWFEDGDSGQWVQEVGSITHVKESINITPISVNTTLGGAHEAVNVTAECTITLPSAATFISSKFLIKSSVYGLVTVTSPDLINEDVDVLLTTKHTSITVVSDGTTWHIF